MSRKESQTRALNRDKSLRSFCLSMIQSLWHLNIPTVIGCHVSYKSSDISDLFYLNANFI